MQTKDWSAACHLSSLLGYLTCFIGNIIGPLVLWILKKDESSEIDYHGKESLNFNLTILLYGALFVIPTFLTFGIGGFILYPALVAFHVILTIIAGIKANKGENYRYPLTIRFVD